MSDAAKQLAEKTWCHAAGSPLSNKPDNNLVTLSYVECLIERESIAFAL